MARRSARPPRAAYYPTTDARTQGPAVCEPKSDTGRFDVAGGITNRSAARIRTRAVFARRRLMAWRTASLQPRAGPHEGTAGEEPRGVLGAVTPAQRHAGTGIRGGVARPGLKDLAPDPGSLRSDAGEVVSIWDDSRACRILGAETPCQTHTEPARGLERRTMLPPPNRRRKLRRGDSHSVIVRTATRRGSCVHDDSTAVTYIGPHPSP